MSIRYLRLPGRFIDDLLYIALLAYWMASVCFSFLIMPRLRYVRHVLSRALGSGHYLLSQPYRGMWHTSHPSSEPQRSRTSSSLPDKAIHLFYVHLICRILAGK